MNFHLHDNPEAKKIIWIVVFVLVAIFVFFGINDWQKKNVPNAHPCVIDFAKTFMYGASTSTSQRVIATTLLSQLLEQYKVTPDCPTLGITDYQITAIGKPVQVKTDFTVSTTFDVVPQSKDKTLWAMASTTWDGNWIRGEHVNLGITNVSTTTKSQSYRLVVQ